MTSGFGRGGRGAALLKLLEQPVRRPGQQAQPSDDSDSGPQVQYHSPQGLYQVLMGYICSHFLLPSPLPPCTPTLHLRNMDLLAEGSPASRYLAQYWEIHITVTVCVCYIP